MAIQKLIYRVLMLNDIAWQSQEINEICKYYNFFFCLILEIRVSQNLVKVGGGRERNLVN